MSVAVGAVLFACPVRGLTNVAGAERGMAQLVIAPGTAPGDIGAGWVFKVTGPSVAAAEAPIVRAPVVLPVAPDPAAGFERPLELGAIDEPVSAPPVAPVWPGARGAMGFGGMLGRPGPRRRPLLDCDTND